MTHLLSRRHSRRAHRHCRVNVPKVPRRCGEVQAARSGLTIAPFDETIWNARTVMLGFAAVCASIAVYGLSGLYPTYLRSALAFTPQQTGFVMSAIERLLRSGRGGLGDRFGHQRILMVALPAAAVSGSLPFTELHRSVYLHAGAAIIFGFAVLSLLYSNMSAIIIDSMSAARTSQSSGMFIASYYIPASFAGYLEARLKEVTDWTKQASCRRPASPWPRWF